MSSINSRGPKPWYLGMGAGVLAVLVTFLIFANQMQPSPPGTTTADGVPQLTTPTPLISQSSTLKATQYVVFAWNDLGMHCLNPSYDSAVVLPPYNTIWCQVVQRGNPPRVVTQGLTVSYRILNNTYSYGKNNFSGFWDNVLKLFGVNVEKNKGLNLVDPSISNGLSGNMVSKVGHFEVDGIPLTPILDNGVWDPFQIAEITVKNSSGTIVASTYTTAPTSEEMDCAKCHGADAFNNILATHDRNEGTTLATSKPVLCSSCHGSPVLNSSHPGTSYLSEAMHNKHATVSPQPGCYDCHPGQVTKCQRSTSHGGQSNDGNCQACHGDIATVGSSITSGGRVPWEDEPACSQCHSGIAGIDTGSTLFRNATGHGNLNCEACHSSTHATIPTNVMSDNYQALQYQGEAVPIGSCEVCHNNSKGPGGLGDYLEVHGGTSPEEYNACYVCHTSVNTTNASQWPHSFQWKSRSLLNPGPAPVLPTTSPNQIPPGTTSPPPTTVPGGAISFTGSIQPLLNQYCVQCHNPTVTTAGLDLSNYSGTRFAMTPGNASTSLLYLSLIGSGVAKMPPGGSLTGAQIQLFADWINQGAPNTTAPPGSTTPPPPTTTSPPATTGTTVSYSASIQPLLNTYCVSCHGSSSASAGVNLSNYSGTRATVSTPPIAANSRLYKSLIGQGASRMPPGSPLSAAQIQLVADWINQGALNTTTPPPGTTGPPTTTVPPPGTTGATVSYAASIKPILDTSCVSCHGSSSPSAGVNLSTYAGTRATISTPPNATNSRLYKSLIGQGASKMPPGSSLPAAQIQLVADWINQGALNN